MTIQEFVETVVKDYATQYPNAPKVLWLFFTQEDLDAFDACVKYRVIDVVASNHVIYNFGGVDLVVVSAYGAKRTAILASDLNTPAWVFEANGIVRKNFYE